MTTVRHLDAAARGRTLRSAVVAGHAIYLSSDSTVPYYVQIAQQLTYLIYSRQLQPGAALPSVRNLATELGVTSNTVSQAYAELQATGLAIAVKGSGTYVRDDVFTQDDDWHVRNELAAEAVAQARRRIHSLGLDDADLQRHVMGVMHGPGRLCEVAFAAPSRASAQKFASSIEAAIGQDGVLASAVEFAELADPGPETRDLLERVYYIVTFVSTRHTVAKLLEPRGPRHRIIGISLELVSETVESLAALDPQLDVAIVTTERYFDIALNVVQSNSRLDPSRIQRMTVDEDPRLLARRLARVDKVIYTFGASADVERLAVPEGRRLLIGFRMDDASMANLAGILASGGTR